MDELRRTMSLPPQTSPSDNRLHTIDAMRGLAALAVVWYHITFGEPTFLGPGALRATGHYAGVAGVYAFFVISGFIIPWALYRAEYTHRGFPRFIAKRMARLDPPYLASILFILAADVVARRTGFAWHLHAVTTKQLLAHLGYLNALFGYRWINDVYWTLGIELQYYVLVALIFPLAMRLPAPRRWLVPLALVIATWLPRPRLGGAPFHDDLILKYLGVFAIGFLCFLHRTGALDWRRFVVMLTLATVAVWWRLDQYIAISACTAALAISFLTVRHRALMWLGEISYSLYLFHEPVRWIFYAAVRQYTAPGSYERVLVAFGTLVVSLALGRAMYLLVERPSQRFASKLRYSRPSAATPWTVDHGPWTTPPVDLSAQDV